jgi:peptidoglycan hydrolase-like protein with peptidoglycan-binding domain
MKRAIAHLIFAICVAGLMRADQATQSVQQALKEQGFYYGNVTGDKSAETTAALRRYQIRNGLQVTGEIDPETLRSLNVGSNSTSSTQPTSKPAVTQSKSARPDDSSVLGQNSLPRPSTEPDRRLEMNPPFQGGPYQLVPRRLNKRMAVAEVQRQLMSRGFYRGRIDGTYGRWTAFGVRAFQLQSALPPTGRLDRSTLDALGLSDASLAYSQPAPRSYEMWVPITKFKHGKWKVKWKKYHRGDSDEYGLEGREGDRDGWWQGEGHDD